MFSADSELKAMAQEGLRDARYGKKWFRGGQRREEGGIFPLTSLFGGQQTVHLPCLLHKITT